MKRSLLLTSLSSLVLFIPSHGISHEGGGSHAYSIKPLKTISVAVPAPLDPLEAIYINKLRPIGTYANSYAWGNCTAFVASRLPIPNDWGNANNWAYAAMLAGYTVSSIPKVGSIAQTAGDSYLGHVAIVEAVDGNAITISEENAQGLGVVDTRTTTTAEFPNFIYI